ncbi:hypothetical protein [Nocardioides campestrisoli]|uniref:hypothetical protein n=1 Tax=Nocardioides campestrisoli TaxID=2736757 RepID=UPI00163D8F19|nr:hypothetical protein [Nocardioides campestrisoli]
MITAIGAYILGMGLSSQLLSLSAQGQTARAVRYADRYIPLGTGLGCTAFFLLLTFNVFPSLSPVDLGLAVTSALIGALLTFYSWIDYGTGRFARSTILRGIIPLTAFVSIGLISVIESEYSLSTGLGVYAVASLTATIWLREKLRGGTSMTKLRLTDIIGRSAAFFLAQTLMLFWLRAPVLASSLHHSPAITAVVGIALSVAELQNYLPQMRAAITFQETAASKSRGLSIPQLRSALITMIPGTIAVLLTALCMSVLLPPDYADLPYLVLAATPGVAALAVGGSAASVLAASHRSGVQACVLVITLLPTVAWLAFSWPVPPIQLLSAWSVGALCTGGILVGLTVTRSAK